MLVFLSLISAAMAAPQLYPYYGSYGMYGYPSYGYPMVQSPMVSAYPLAGYPSVGQRIAPYPMAGTRNLITLGNFLQLNGVFEQVATATTTVPATTVKGNFNIQQNGILDVFSGNEAKFTMYLMSSADLTGKNVKIMFATGASCVAAIAATTTHKELAMVNVPPSINGFYISGTTKGFNIDGMNSKTALMGASNWLVLTESGSVIGCSKTALQ